MRNLEEKEIKQFSEFTEVTPESSQNLITDKGRFTVGALFSAVVAYATDLINAAVNSAVSGVQALITSAAEDAAEEAVEGVQETIAAATSSAVTQAETAKTAAESAKTAAETAKSGAETAKETAVAKAEQAASDADAVAADKAAVQTIKTEVQSLKSAAEAAAQSAQEAVFSKANTPQLWFDGGKLMGSNFPIPTFPFSICAQVRIDGWKGSSDVSQSIFQCGTYGSTQLVSLAFLDTSSAPCLGIQVSSTSDATTTSSAFRCNFDYSDFIGKDHTIVAVCRNLDSSDTLDWSIYLDGEAMTGSPTKNLKIDALGGSVEYAVNTVNGNFPSQAACANPMRLSRLAVFNFDMSAEGAPYTVADYAAGKLVPPKLLRSVIFGGKNYNIYYKSNAKNTYDAATSALTFFQAAGSESALASLLFNVNFPVHIAEGKSVKITYDSITGDAVQNSGGAYAYISFYDSSSQYVLGDAQLTSLSGETIVKTQTASYASRKLERVCVYAYTTASSEAEQTIKINGLRIEVDGAVLYLDGSADGPQVRDESGGGRHALISGSVLASRQNNPARCVQTITWAGTSTLQNVCGESALPANSKVTAYAKATGAVTASFKAAANAAQSKDLAADTFTEIGSWVCGAAGAFSVQPSAAYTGNIEVYLIIEKL